MAAFVVVSGNWWYHWSENCMLKNKNKLKVLMLDAVTYVNHAIVSIGAVHGKILRGSVVLQPAWVYCHAYQYNVYSNPIIHIERFEQRGWKPGAFDRVRMSLRSDSVLASQC